MTRTILTMAVLALGAAPAQAGSRAISPDGRYVATILPNGVGREDGTNAEVLVIEEQKTGARRHLLTSRYDENSHDNLTNLVDPLFSVDGRSLYVSSSDAAPTSGAVHRIDLKTGAVRFVVTGTALSVIRTGPYRGDLLVQQHRYYDSPEGGSFNAVYVIRPDGHEALLVPGSDKDDGETAVRPWLAKMGWRVW